MSTSVGRAGRLFRPRRDHALGGLAILMLVSGAGPTPAVEVPRFYERGAEGWFWYAPEPPIVVVLEPEPEPDSSPVLPLASESPPAAPADSAHETTPAGPAPLSAAWLRAHLEHYQQRAIDDPHPTNVALYLYLQRIALDKASRFADAYQRVVQSDPYLDETTRGPVGNYSHLLNRLAGEQRANRLQALAGEAGIWFFYRSDCPYCTAQAPVLGLLAARTGLRVQAIALDGRPLAGGHFPAFRRDAGQAAHLGVVSTPALFLVRPPDGIVPLAQGLLSLSDLEQRLVRAAHDAGWIDDAAYARTRPQVADLRLDWDLERPLSVPEDPDAFLELLRARVMVELSAPAWPPGRGAP